MPDPRELERLRDEAQDAARILTALNRDAARLFGQTYPSSEQALKEVLRLRSRLRMAAASARADRADREPDGDFDRRGREVEAQR